MKYRHLPTEVDAVQWTGSNFLEIQKFAEEHADQNRDRTGRPKLVIQKPDGFVAVWIQKSRTYGVIGIDDYLIGEADGDGVYPCVKAHFEAAYTVVV
jgi:hypothetical protein